MSTVTEIGIARERKSHIFLRHPYDRYVEPAWCTRRLFAVERFAGVIWDPACGLGTILKAARDARYSSYGSDIAQDATGTVQDFLTATAPVREFSIVTNPRRLDWSENSLSMRSNLTRSKSR
jgi:hypothetical protein